jgi:hypothetical protein
VPKESDGKYADFATPTLDFAMSRLSMYFFTTGLLFNAILMQSLSVSAAFFSICIDCIALTCSVSEIQTAVKSIFNLIFILYQYYKRQEHSKVHFFV